MKFIKNNLLKSLLSITLKSFIFLNLTVSPMSFACTKTVTISASINWPPISYLKNNTFHGLDIDILNHVLPKAGLCWNYVHYPSSSRSLKELKKGNVDILFAASITKEREKYAVYSAPYRDEVMQLFAHTKNQQKLESFTQDKFNILAISTKSVIAINRGSYYGEMFAQFKELCGNCVVETNFTDERINMIKLNRVDFAIEELLAGNHLIKKLNISEYVEATPITINRNPVYLMLNPNTFNENDIKRLNKAILQSTNEINNLINSYELALTQ